MLFSLLSSPLVCYLSANAIRENMPEEYPRNSVPQTGSLLFSIGVPQRNDKKLLLPEPVVSALVATIVTPFLKGLFEGLGKRVVDNRKK